MTEDVFFTIVTLLPINGTKSELFSQIRMELPKEGWGIEQDIVTVAVEPSQILLLK